MRAGFVQRRNTSNVILQQVPYNCVAYLSQDTRALTIERGSLLDHAKVSFQLATESSLSLDTRRNKSLTSCFSCLIPPDVVLCVLNARPDDVLQWFQVIGRTIANESVEQVARDKRDFAILLAQPVDCDIKRRLVRTNHFDY